MSFQATLAVCTHRDVKFDVMRTLWQLNRCQDPKVNLIAQVGDALISRARNRAATRFYDGYPDSEMLAFLDDDVEIKPEDLVRMMVEVHENKYPILGAVYALKDYDKTGFAFLTHEKGKVAVKMGESGGIIPVKRVSTGCMVIRRDVFARMLKKDVAHLCGQGYYSFFQHREILEGGVWNDMSEDWWLCSQAQKLGFGVFLDTRPKTNHWGLFPYNWDYAAMNGQKKILNSVELPITSR